MWEGQQRQLQPTFCQKDRDFKVPKSKLISTNALVRGPQRKSFYLCKSRKRRRIFDEKSLGWPTDPLLFCLKAYYKASWTRRQVVVRCTFWEYNAISEFLGSWGIQLTAPFQRIMISNAFSSPRIITFWLQQPTRQGNLWVAKNCNVYATLLLGQIRSSNGQYWRIQPCKCMLNYITGCAHIASISFYWIGKYHLFSSAQYYKKAVNLKNTFIQSEKLHVKLLSSTTSLCRFNYI